MKGDLMKMNKDELREYLNKDIESLRSLNFSEPYIKSVSENTSKWAGTGLLGGISDPHIGRNVATLLENQRLFNEQWPGNGASLIPEGAETDIPMEHWASQWKRISIPVMRRVFGENFIGHHIVSVQAMKSSQENTYLIGFDGRTTSGMTEANTRRLSVSWEPPVWKYSEDGSVKWVEFRGEKYMTGLDAEAEATAIFAEAICHDFSREIIRDLALNAGKLAVYEYKDENHLLSLVEGMSAYIAAKCYNREATWVVTSPTIVKLLGEYIEPATDQWNNIVNINAQRDGVNKVGVLNKKWQLFEDSTAPAGNILFGYKNAKNHFDAGYIFSPYLPVNPTPSWRTNEQEQRGQVLARYGKRLVNPGFYGTLKIENLPEATPLEKPEPEEAESEE